MWNKTAVPLTLLLLTGCASVITDKTQPIKVETMTASGNKVTDAECELQNDRGAYDVKSSKTVFVRKSAGNLIVTCNAPDQPDADATLISRTGGAVFGNIILGGVIGAVVDTASGVAYNYPEWVQLVFGKSLTFDRSNFKNAQPTPPTHEADIAPSAENGERQQPESEGSAQPIVQKVEYITIVAPSAPGATEKEEK